MNSFELIVSTPNGTVYNEKVRSLSVRGSEGELAVMAGHIPFVTSVKPCECRIAVNDDTMKSGVIEGGILTVSREKVILLTGSFKWKDN